jgi:hypothetical protein
MKTLISLGFNCYIKKYLLTKQSTSTNLFDYIGAPMWAICELLENNFNELTEKKHFSYKKILNNEKEIWINKKYYIRFKHDLNNYSFSEKEFDVFKKKYDRRIERFFDLLKRCELNNKEIIFIRLEENNNNRIIYEEYKQKYEKDELYYYELFCDIIQKLYPKLKFELLVISNNNSNRYKNITILNDPKINEYKWDDCEKYIENILSGVC